MHTRKHLFALGLLGMFGVLVATSAKKPAGHPVGRAPVVERNQMALVASYVVSASDVCVRANAPDPNALDATSLQTLKDACTKAAEEQAAALNWNEREWVPEEVNGDSSGPGKRVPRVARRNAGGTNEEPAAARNRN